MGPLRATRSLAAARGGGKRTMLQRTASSWRVLKVRRGRMVTEIAQIDVKPGMEAEFESGVQKARPLFLRALGCTGVSLHRSIEKPQRYRLLVQWDTLENHTVDFRNSEDFKA